MHAKPRLHPSRFGSFPHDPRAVMRQSMVWRSSLRPGPFNGTHSWLASSGGGSSGGGCGIQTGVFVTKCSGSQQSPPINP